MKKTEQGTSQAQKTKHLSPSTRNRNAQRINQWKAKRDEAVGDNKICAQTQTDDSNSIIDDTNSAATQRRPSSPQTNNIDTKKGAIVPDKNYINWQANNAYKISRYGRIPETME